MIRLILHRGSVRLLLACCRNGILTWLIRNRRQPLRQYIHGSRRRSLSYCGRPLFFPGNHQHFFQLCSGWWPVARECSETLPVRPKPCSRFNRQSFREYSDLRHWLVLFPRLHRSSDMTFSRITSPAGVPRKIPCKRDCSRIAAHPAGLVIDKEYLRDARINLQHSANHSVCSNHWHVFIQPLLDPLSM